MQTAVKNALHTMQAPHPPTLPQKRGFLPFAKCLLVSEFSLDVRSLDRTAIWAKRRVP